jgi:DNA-binding NarL/FixJ family response regulator
MTPSAPITILIADDHPIFRKGLRDIIAAEPSLRLVAEVADGLAAWEQLRNLTPAVAVLDLEMPGLDGLEVAGRVRRARLAVALIVLTMHKEEDLFHHAMDAGVLGYLLKDNAAEDLLHCVSSVAAGRPFISPGLSAFLLRRASMASALHRAQPGLSALTPTERRILQLIAQDLTSKEIADRLGASVRTIDNHRSHISEKLGLHGSHSLLKFAYDHKSSL